ncbi:MAG: hypothetical protein DRQ51_06935 [Gammaproteobacteria bacterium]|nr:MAG: hypothetical protein DRQ51_06935 [Gammaproteobacteria bacterium]
MKKFIIVLSLLLLPILSIAGEKTSVATDAVKTVKTMVMPFGDKTSVADANALWQEMVKQGLAGKDSKISKLYKGTPPHGAILDTVEKDVTVNGRTGKVVIKKNYGGKEISNEKITSDPAKWLKAITVMFKREKGYDDENQNWFYAKYKADGSLHFNPKDPKKTPLAGRVAKGMPQGCIACHKAAAGGNYLFTR